MPVFAQEGYRRTISIYVTNTGSFPNHVQVRDVKGRYGVPEDCRIAKKVAPLCEGNRNRYMRRSRGETGMTCAAALALLDEPRCAIRDLIFDDWIDPDMKVKLDIHTDTDGFGVVAVRSVNNTDSWTYKPGLTEGDTVNHQ